MDEEDHIPPTAKQIKVTNVIDPYHIRIYEVENDTEQLNQLEQKLQHLSKTKLRKYHKDCGPKIGDLVLIESNRDDTCFKFELPAWFCRGVVLCGKDKSLTYPVMLVDHGIVLNFWIEDLKILPQSSIPIEYLTTAIGINDIIPITVENKVAKFSDHWSELAIEFTRKMINASKAEYFDHLTSDKSGNRYGELYLIIENEIVALSKALVCNLFGTMLKDDSEESKKKPDPPAPQASTTSDDKPHSSKSMGEKSEQKRKDVKKTDRMSKNDRNVDPDQRILIRSKFEVKPIYSVEDAGFHSRLQKTLRSLKISRPKNLQGYIWPAVCRGLDVAVVEAPKTGKTLSYLIPIISSIIGNESRRQARGPKGPFAVILCVSSLEVSRIFESCSKILKDNDNVAVLPAYNGISEITIVAKILNGCDIIISTPPYFSRVMKNDPKLLNFDRLTHLVFDGADIILQKYNNSLGLIFKIPPAVEKKRRGLINRIRLQIIAVSQYWTPEVNILVKGFMHDPYTCIASYMEAAVYAELKPKLICKPRNQKPATVVELLGTRWTMIKTVIICVSTEEAEELVQILTKNSIDNFLVHEKTTITEIKGIKETWMAMVSGKYFVLVCTDPVVLDLDIKDADCLIHYSLESRTKTEFYRRFSTLLDNFGHHVRSKDKIRPRAILLADESSDAQLSGIVTMLRRLDCKIPEALEANLEMIILTVEMAKVDRRLCNDLKAFGSCPKKDSCGSRHCIIPQVDKPITDIRANDWVKLVLTGTHSTNHYSARILEYQPADTKEWISFSFKEFNNLSFEMQKHFSNPARRRSAKVVNIGDICAIEDALEIYKRVQILSSVNKDEIETQSVHVRCIDDGATFYVKASHLLEVPDNLAQWPSHIVDIYLTDIKPFDNEPAWSPCAGDIVSDWLQENLAYSASCIFGKVVLHISYNMWVDPLEVRYELQKGFPVLCDSTLKSKLIDEKCALENKEHVENLLKLCRDSNMEIERKT